MERTELDIFASVKDNGISACFCRQLYKTCNCLRSQQRPATRGKLYCQLFMRCCIAKWIRRMLNVCSVCSVLVWHISPSHSLIWTLHLDLASVGNLLRQAAACVLWGWFRRKRNDHTAFCCKKYAYWIYNPLNTCTYVCSWLPWFDMFYKLLEKLGEVRGQADVTSLESCLSTLYALPVPLPSHTVLLPLAGFSQVTLLTCIDWLLYVCTSYFCAFFMSC